MAVPSSTPQAHTPTLAVSQTASTLPSGGMSMPGVFAWFVAWGVILGVLYALSRTRWGHTIVYYVLWLSVVLVIVSHSSAITSVFAQGNITQGQY